MHDRVPHGICLPRSPSARGHFDNFIAEAAVCALVNDSALGPIEAHDAPLRACAGLANWCVHESPPAAKATLGITSRQHLSEHSGAGFPSQLMRTLIVTIATCALLAMSACTENEEATSSENEPAARDAAPGDLSETTPPADPPADAADQQPPQ